MIFTPSELKRKFFFILFDIIIIIASTYIAFNLRFDFSIPIQFIESIYITIFSLVVLRVSFFNYFRIYNISWRHFGFKDTTSLIYMTFLATLLFVIVVYFFQYVQITIPRSIIAIEFFISLFLSLAIRISKRFYLESKKINLNAKSTIVIAHLNKANDILRTISNKESPYYPVAVIDEKHKNIKVNGVEVYSLKKFIELEIIAEVAIVDASVDLSEIYVKLINANIKTVKIASDYDDYGAQIKDVSVEDLLARHPKDLDKNKIEAFIKDKVVMITGAGGSIGSEISRQCKKFQVKHLILLDHSEFNLYTIHSELSDANFEVSAVMQSIRNIEILENTFKKYKPQIVIHAAAYKHVPLVEENILEGISNNIIGTKNCIDLSIKYEVEKFVLISTDKAVRPTNVMGCTKRVCELYAQNVKVNLDEQKKKTEIVAVRFGNVLGSSGSVIPKFKSQIEQGKNLTVTHPDITRYFMLIPEACELVLQAGAIAKGGEIFILDMGEPIKIVDLAKKMIELSGRDDISIEFCGLRQGEKLYEELLINDTDKKTEYESITVASPTYFEIELLNKKIDQLLSTEDKIAILKEIVPEFDHRLNG